MKTGLAPIALCGNQSPSIGHCYIIAGIGTNHNGDINHAKRLIDFAVQSGCNAVKFHKRDADCTSVKTYLDRPTPRHQFLGRTYREVLERVDLSKAEFRDLRAYCKGRIDFIVSPFDIPSLHFIDDLDVDAIAVEAVCTNNVFSLKEVANGKSRVMVSIGLCTEDEIEDIVDAFADKKLTLIHSIHMTPFEANISYLKVLRWLEQFGKKIGYSDNEAGSSMALSAIAFGASVIDKSLTFDNNLSLSDSAIGLTPVEFSKFVKLVRDAENESISDIRRKAIAGQREIYDNEQVSIVAKRRINKGETIMEDMLAFRSPFRGLSPRCVPLVAGKKALYDMEEDEFITTEVVEL
ncbi:MAG TPA: hypothetical protein DHV16_11590 [Nitrospiraceae bacterium]|nr:hypothetical protein [Nitrospiraceae bacterium]